LTPDPNSEIWEQARSWILKKVTPATSAVWLMCHRWCNVENICWVMLLVEVKLNL